MQIKRLDNIGIAVSDIRRAIAFYTDVLGLEGQAGESDGSVTVGDLSFYVFQTNKAPAPVGRTADYMNNPVGLDHLAFEVADIEQAGRDLEAKGVAFNGPLVGNPGEFRYRGFADPDGNMLYIIQRPG